MCILTVEDINRAYKEAANGVANGATGYVNVVVKVPVWFVQPTKTLEFQEDTGSITGDIPLVYIGCGSSYSGNATDASGLGDFGATMNQVSFSGNIGKLLEAPTIESNQDLSISIPVGGVTGSNGYWYGVAPTPGQAGINAFTSAVAGETYKQVLRETANLPGVHLNAMIQTTVGRKTTTQYYAVQQGKPLKIENPGTPVSWEEFVNKGVTQTVGVSSVNPAGTALTIMRQSGKPTQISKQESIQAGMNFDYFGYFCTSKSGQIGGSFKPIGTNSGELAEVKKVNADPGTASYNQFADLDDQTYVDRVSAAIATSSQPIPGKQWLGTLVSTSGEDALLTIGFGIEK